MDFKISISAFQSDCKHTFILVLHKSSVGIGILSREKKLYHYHFVSLVNRGMAGQVLNKSTNICL